MKWTRVAVAGLALAIAGCHSNDEPTTEPAVECFEDMPCWDCHTMGNLVCGESTTWEVTAND